jgi:hypothetical protein
MLAVFALRLAFGMLACLLLLSPAQVNPRFYRVHFLVALGLAALVLLDVRTTAPLSAIIFLSVGLFLAFAGSFSWSLEEAPGGRTLIVLTAAALAAALVVVEMAPSTPRPLAATLVGDVTAAALLGASVTAMLLGHNYLVAPSMSIRPLMTLLVAINVTALLRGAVDGWALWDWTRSHSLDSLSNDLLLWLPVRWLLGIVGPLVLNWMVWQTAKIRSTQSATGILYVLVIFCFLGELTGQLLREPGLTL